MCCYSKYSPGLVLADHCSILSKGGVSGGVLDGELVLGSGLIVKGGVQAKQTLPGQGPKFAPPQLMHGGVGGGVHADGPLLGRGGCRGALVSEVGGEDVSEVVIHCDGR